MPPTLAGLNSYPEGPLLAGPMLGEAGATFARVWVQARDESRLTLTLHLAEGDLDLTLCPSAEAWLCGVFHISGVTAGQTYAYTLSSAHGETERYRLCAAPEASARRLRVAFGSCFFYYDRPAPIFDAIRAEEADVFIMAGDNCYYVQNEWESRFQNKPTSLAVFRRAWAQRAYGTSAVTGIFSTVRLGPVEIFLLDGRYDRIEGVQILGKPQLEWLFDRLQASCAPVKLLISGSQMLPEAAGQLGWECWRRDAPGELDHLVSFLGQHAIEGVVFASGDVHLGYLLHERGHALPDGRVGPELWELTSSPLSNDTWPQTVTRSGRPDRYLVKELESLNYGLIDVDLDRAGREVRLLLKDEHGAVLLDQPIGLDQLRVRSAADAARPALPVETPPPAPPSSRPSSGATAKPTSSTATATSASISPQATSITPFPSPSPRSGAESGRATSTAPF